MNSAMRLGVEVDQPWHKSLDATLGNRPGKKMFLGIVKTFSLSFMCLAIAFVYLVFLR
ncbi:hypothetical protein BDV23DRAFT_157298 [Aspergillus alliaceus]|uniref:Uncharacterized protein n=1 Tax=Petromyces alliaceus TaxID=209559 RepID=A0A5N7C5C4_PETAA|nr:hypothetical protein BDV23DRAFT_157298 [Aspergillus alliaceus]